MNDNVLDFPRRPDPDVHYAAIEDFEPTSLGHVISVAAGTHKDGLETYAILMIGPDSCDEPVAVLAEWRNGAVRLVDIHLIAQIARRGLEHAAAMVPVTPGPDDGDVVPFPGGHAA